MNFLEVRSGIGNGCCVADVVSISSNSHPQKLEARICVNNELWEEVNNEKVRDLDVPQPTLLSIYINEITLAGISS
jgi:hypothetical protein